MVVAAVATNLVAALAKVVLARKAVKKATAWNGEDMVAIMVKNIMDSRNILVTTEVTMDTTKNTVVITKSVTSTTIMDSNTISPIILDTKNITLVVTAVVTEAVAAKAMVVAVWNMDISANMVIMDANTLVITVVRDTIIVPNGEHGNNPNACGRPWTSIQFLKLADLTPRILKFRNSCKISTPPKLKKCTMSSRHCSKTVAPRKLAVIAVARSNADSVKKVVTNI